MEEFLLSSNPMGKTSQFRRMADEDFKFEKEFWGLI